MPRHLREQVRREAYLTNEIIMKAELAISHGKDGVLTDEEISRIRHRVVGDMMMEKPPPDPGEEPETSKLQGLDPADSVV